MECELLGKLIFNYKCQDIVKLIELVTNKNINKPLDLEDNEHEDIIKQIKRNFKLGLFILYGIKGYKIIIDEDAFDAPNKYYDFETKMFGEVNKFNTEYNDYLMIIKE